MAVVFALPEPRRPLRRVCGDLARRVKLLAPLFDELRDDVDSLGWAELCGLESLCAALVQARDVLRSVDDGSKLYQAVRQQKFDQIFLKVTESIGKALGEISLGDLSISVEVKEQVTKKCLSFEVSVVFHHVIEIAAIKDQK